MQNTHEGYINIPKLPPEACKAYLFDDMQSSLISVGQLCDADCTVQFDQHQVTIFQRDEIILQGQRDRSSGLYHVELSTPQDSQSPASSIDHHAAMSAIAAETI